MTPSQDTRVLLYIFIIFFFFAWALTGVYFLTHTKYVNSDWAAWHQQTAEDRSPDSNQFRLLSFWLAEGASKLFDQPIAASYLTVRFVFTFFTFCVFHLFLLKWFDHMKAFLCATLLAAITPITYLPLLQEADVVVGLFFLLGFWLIRERLLLPLAALIALGTFAKESIVFLVPMYSLYLLRRDRVGRTIAESTILVGVWTLAFYITRNGFYDGTNSPLWQLPNNLKTLGQTFAYNPFMNIYIYFIPIFGLFWALPFMRLKEKPFFFQRAAWFIVVYIIFHFLGGWPYETRIILPLAFLVIPSGLMTLFPADPPRESA